MTASVAHLPDDVLRVLARSRIGVVTDPDILAGHGTDWTGQWSGPVLALVRPTSTDQVAVVLAAARSGGVPVQVQGGNTGLVGGSVPDRPSLLLSTTALARLDPVDVRERSVLVGAGVTLARLATHAAGSGLRVGVDLAARDSATLGGMAATNAGGIGVCAFGMMRDQVRGLTAVLADGRIVRTAGRPRKDNTGYDLTGLLVGSEGTLGVITEVELALHPQPRATSVGLLGVASLAQAVECARLVQSGPYQLLAAEVVDAAGVTRAARVVGVPDPLPRGSAWLLLLEVADGGTADGFEPLADSVVAVATDAVHRGRLWALRERQTEIYAAQPGAGPEKFDVSLRLDRLDEGVAAIRALVEDPAANGSSGAPAHDRPGDRPRVRPDDRPDDRPGDRPWVGCFGHALDGNLHVQVVNARPDTAERILAAVAGLGGSISAEHGIGRLKAGQLHLARSADEISWMRQLRASVDPGDLLNPGVLLGDPQAR